MQHWSPADISSVILRTQHAGVRLSPPNTPIKRTVLNVHPAPRPHHAALPQQPVPVPPQGSVAQSGRIARYRNAAAAANTHERSRQPPPHDDREWISSDTALTNGARGGGGLHALASAEPHASPPSAAAAAAKAISISGRNFAFLHKHISRDANYIAEAEGSPVSWNASGDSSGHQEHLTQYSSASTTQLAAAAREKGADEQEDAVGAAAAQEHHDVLDSFRRQVVSNEMELLRQRLAIAHLELHNRNKDYELLQRAVAVTEYRAAAAERALADLQHKAQASADITSRPLQLEASTNTPRQLPVAPGDDGATSHCSTGGSGCADASTQTAGSGVDTEAKYVALLQELTHSPPDGGSTRASSLSPHKYSSQKSSVSLEHVNAKADHLADKLEELLFNMSVQQREFSKLSRAATTLFRTLVQSLQAMAHCYSILSGGHGEQCRQRR